MTRDNQNNIIVTNTNDKLEVIGAFLANINNREVKGKPIFTDFINRQALSFIEKIEQDMTNNSTLYNFSENNDSINPKHIDYLQNYFIDIESLGRKFRKLNNKKSSGIDGIPNIVLKHIPLKVIRAYTILFNNLLNYRIFPTHWKKAKVIAILKKDKDSSNPLNYRPISLLPNISKVYEMVINDAILKVCNHNNTLPENQFGFRFRHSTVHAINKLTSDICWALNDNKCVGACLIDLEKAFDSVWHEGLIVNLIQKNFPHYLIEIIRNMICNRTFITSIGETTSSTEFPLRNGLQQGTVNSPILFNIFTSNVLKLFNPTTEYPIHSIAFADDLIIYHADKWPSRIQDKLQDIFERIHSYYHSWKLNINTKKCETILFRPNLAYANKNVRKCYKTFKIKENKHSERFIPHKKHVKYLGIYLDDKLKFNNHIENQLLKARKAFLTHKRLFYSKHLHRKIKIICYQLLIRPIITYGCPIWYNISASQMEKIRSFERKCLRSCLSMYYIPDSNYKKLYSNKRIYDKADIHRIDTFILKLIRDHFANASNIIQNSLIHGSLYPNPLYYEKTLKSGFIPPEAFPYLDSNEYIQDKKNIPIIYHAPRHKNVKKILYEPKSDCLTSNLKYSTSLPSKDENDTHRKNTEKYWWLQ